MLVGIPQLSRRKNVVIDFCPVSVDSKSKNRRTVVFPRNQRAASCAPGKHRKRRLELVSLPQRIFLRNIVPLNVPVLAAHHVSERGYVGYPVHEVLRPRFRCPRQIAPSVSLKTPV